MNSLNLNYWVFDEEGDLIRKFSTKISASHFIHNKEGFSIQKQKQRKETRDEMYTRFLKEVGECLL